MIIGIPKETKVDENRVSMTPEGVEVLAQHGHTVLVEAGAGVGSGFEDAAYTAHGAEIVAAPPEIFRRAELILRVKEPQPAEFDLLRPGQIYFSYLHLAASPEVTRVLMERQVVAMAYETIQRADGSLPLLIPMSEIAGQMAVQEGAKYLEMAQGGDGVLLGGVPGVDPGKVMILGGGKVGLSAAKRAAGLGAKVYVLDINLERLRYLNDVLPRNCFTVMSNPANIRQLITKADVVIGAVLIPGSQTPQLVSREMVKTMKKGAVLIDVSIDQGGCFATSRETTHAKPTYVIEGVVHYAVSNMPGAVPKTATMALTNATLPYVLQLADRGWQLAAQSSPEIRQGINVAGGLLTYAGVADALGLAYTPVDNVLG
ncbi:MAG: alanine dehydrogenase [Anaerolineae bacterium]